MPFGIHPEDMDEVKSPFETPIDKNNNHLLKARIKEFEQSGKKAIKETFVANTKNDKSETKNKVNDKS